MSSNQLASRHQTFNKPFKRFFKNEKNSEGVLYYYLSFDIDFFTGNIPNSKKKTGILREHLST